MRTQQEVMNHRFPSICVFLFTILRWSHKHVNALHISVNTIAISPQNLPRLVIGPKWAYNHFERWLDVLTSDRWIAFTVRLDCIHSFQTKSAEHLLAWFTCIPKKTKALKGETSNSQITPHFWGGSFFQQIASLQDQQNKSESSPNCWDANGSRRSSGVSRFTSLKPSWSAK